ncbi:type II toxin-antitoxin system VapC family toxin [Sphingomonas sp. VNH70]|uniref:type II toxin-antitoxin system VapC family toxin n=1 Tax=Sphingomonas silueang TaxID=3156617 RepID=UPI0032B33E7F
MTLFVDASALIAVIAQEPGHDGFIDAIAEDADPLWSPMVCWEAIVSLRKAPGYGLERAWREVEAFATARPFRLVPIGEDERRIALDAYHRYGKGRHEASLNMGDCFAYACARTNDARLLYKGDDFARTDIA